MAEKSASTNVSAKRQNVSAPVIVFALALTLVGCGLLVLWELHLLGPFLTSSAFQALTFVLAVLAIIFGAIQFWDSRRHSSKIEQVARSMSTRYIGTFPRDMDNILELIRMADRELLVMCDFIDYGSYSRPEAHERLFNALKDAPEGVMVRCLVYGDKPARDTLANQFKETEFEITRASHRFSHYFQYWSGIKPRDAAAGFAYDEFLGILRDKQEDFTNDLLDKGIEIKTLSEKVLLFFWLQDEQDAVFVFEDIGAEEQGLAFRTRDAKLIETFVGIFNRHWTRAPHWRKTERLVRAQIGASG